MRRNWISTLALCALAITGLAGCQDAGHVMGPDAVGPTTSLTGTASETSIWRILDGPSDATGGVLAVIGAEGGELVLGQQRLVVPAGAVDAPTLFAMKKGGSKLRVTLIASRITLNDVGAAGFAVPVYLTFSYGNAASLPGDPSDLSIVWIREDGSFEPQPTVVDETAKTVTGEIIHFSDYAMATM